MSGHNKLDSRLEEISVVCPCCVSRGDKKNQTMIYFGEGVFEGKSIPYYKCETCKSCRTGPAIEEVNPGISFDK